MLRKPRLALGMTLALAIGSLTAVTTSQAGQVTVYANYAGYVACDFICDVPGDYTVPGLPGWNDGLSSFGDPVPAGAVVVQMTASLQGTGDGSADVAVNGVPLGTSVISGSTGMCNVCDTGTPATSATYDGGFPGYSHGGSQTMQLVSTSATLALDRVAVTIVYRACGDGTTDPGEACDTAGDSPTCDADCTPVVCGDGRFNAAAEACDTGGDSAACDANCTPPSCGDGYTNGAAGEACDGGNGCSPTCQIETNASSSANASASGSTGPGPGSGGSGSSTSGGDGGAGEGGASAAQGPTATSGGEGGASGEGGATETTGPTASGIAVVAVGAGPSGPAGGGGDDDSDGGGENLGDGGASGDSASGASESGCSCTVPRSSTPASSAVVALGLALLARRRRCRASSRLIS